MKGAFLLHGWGTDRRVWRRYWMLENEAPMQNMLNDMGFETIILDLPGSYVQRGKDLEWYARYLGRIIKEREDLDEILLIGHSMGGIVTRMYLSFEDDEFSEGIGRVTGSIMLGSPHHGTSVPHFDRLTSFLTPIADLVNPWNERIKKGDEQNYFMTTPCYRDIQLGSDLLIALNEKGSRRNVDYHFIWTNGDTVAEPQHTCILPGATGHLIDKLAVNHFNMCYRSEVVEEVEGIINGTAEPSGLQFYPPPEGCSHRNGHLWLPEHGLVTREGSNIWECSKCKERNYSFALPVELRCRHSQKIPQMHKWEHIGRFYRYKFKCKRCMENIWYPPIPNGGQ